MPESFKNIVSYVWEHGEPFAERPLCRVDSLVFSQLSYVQLPSAAVEAWGWTGLRLHELWRSDWLEEMTGHMYDPPGARRLAAALAASCGPRVPRFTAIITSAPARFAHSWNSSMPTSLGSMENQASSSRRGRFSFGPVPSSQR